MKIPPPIACALVAAVFATPAAAQSYKWKDAKGQTIISDTPPPASVKTESYQSISPPRATGTGTSGTSNTNAGDSKSMVTAPKTLAEKELAFKKRQQEEQERIEKANKEQKSTAERKHACDTARQAVTTLQSSAPLARVNSKGETVPMDDSTRKSELERALRSAEEACR